MNISDEFCGHCTCFQDCKQTNNADYYDEPCSSFEKKYEKKHEGNHGNTHENKFT